MNLFILDRGVSKAAKKHCDVHVVKMCLETAQILCSALHPRRMPYRPTHLHHPCVMWAAETIGNFIWCLDLGYALAEEYTARYGKEHASLAVIDVCANTRHRSMSLSRTPHVLTMPEEYREKDPVRSYRNFYMSKMVNERMRRYNKEALPLEEIKRFIFSDISALK